MDIDEDDDFYAPEESEAPVPDAVTAAPETVVETKSDAQNDELEEGEEEDEGGEMDEDDSDSDVDIIVDRKDDGQSAPQPQSKYSEIRNIPQRAAGADEAVKAAPPRDTKRSAAPNPGTPVSATSQVDINAIPIHKGTGKPITQVNIDEDLKESEKPWRQPGTDLSDYFNYGFDEFTWALYAEKQEELRGKYNQDAIAQGQKKMMDDMLMMMGGGMMPGMPGAGANTAGGAQMPPMDGMPPEMQAMVQQMMMGGGGGGMDGQMDPSAMAAMFSGMQNGSGGNAAQAAQGQNFQGGFGGAQGQGYGFDQQMAGGNAGGGGRGGFGGRGRGGRRNW